MAGKPGKINVPAILIAILAFSSWQAAAQQPSSPTMSTDDFPPWLLEAMQRESGPFEAQPVTVPARNFNSELYGKSLDGEQQTDLGWYLTTDIEAITPMECWIFTSPVDMAASLRNILELNMSASAKINGEIIDRAHFYLDSGMIGAFPYMTIESLYAMQGESQNLTGFAKVRIARLDDIHLACSHNQLGFRETFARNFEHFVRTAVFDAQAIKPFYRQVYRQSIDGVGIGINETLYVIDGDGDFALTTRDSTLIPADDSGLQADDSYDYSYWRPDNSFINQIKVVSSNGGLVFRLNLLPMGDGAYQVSGEVEGEEVLGGIDDDIGPMSGLQRMLEVQKLMALQEPGSMTSRMWQPEYDPNRMIDVTITLGPGGGEKRVATFDSELITAEVELDESGGIVSTTMPVEMGAYLLQRIFTEGQPPNLANTDWMKTTSGN